MTENLLAPVAQTIFELSKELAKKTGESFQLFQNDQLPLASEKYFNKASQIILYNSQNMMKLCWLYSEDQFQLDYFQELLNLTAGKLKEALLSIDPQFKMSLPSSLNYTPEQEQSILQAPGHTTMNLVVKSGKDHVCQLSILIKAQEEIIDKIIKIKINESTIDLF